MFWVFLVLDNFHKQETIVIVIKAKFGQLYTVTHSLSFKWLRDLSWEYVYVSPLANCIEASFR
jgi:hypothetical protein